MIPDAATLRATLEPLVTVILNYALVLAAIGTVVMTLIEVAKAVFRARMRFHRILVERWIDGEPVTGALKAMGLLLDGGLRFRKKSFLSGAQGVEVRDQMIHLTVGDKKNEKAFYDQPTEKMLGQLQAAANVALDFPSRYPAFYGFLASGSGSSQDQTDHELWKEFSRQAIDPSSPPPREAGAGPQGDLDPRLATAARARLGNLVTRKLDALQILLEYSWARLNQGVAVIGGTALSFGLLLQTHAGLTLWNNNALTVLIVLSLLGGLLAPFAKDVATKLSGLSPTR